LAGFAEAPEHLKEKTIADVNDAMDQTVNLARTFSALILFFITYFVRTKKGGSGELGSFAFVL
jgi:hypothetical protein